MFPLAKTKGLPLLPGSWFATIKGFTQRGCTGIMPEARRLDSEGLYTSALAVELTLVLEKLLPNNEKIRAKKIGRFARCTVTLTTGFTPKFARLGPPLLQS